MRLPCADLQTTVTGQFDFHGLVEAHTLGDSACTRKKTAEVDQALFSESACSLSLTIDGPVSIPVGVLPERHHAQVLDVHRILLVRGREDRRLRLVRLLLLPLVFDLPR